MLFIMENVLFIYLHDFTYHLHIILIKNHKYITKY